MKSIKLLQLAFFFVVTIFQIYEVEAQVIPTTKNQNFQYSNFQFTPLVVNPALAGSDGLYRVSTVYGDKSAGFGDRPFRQFTISSEFSIMKGFKKGDKIGVGLGADLLGLAGVLGRDNNSRGFQNFIFNTSYHYSLNDDASSFLSFGIQYRTGSRSYNQLAQNSTITLTGDKDIDDFNNQGSQNVQNIYGSLNVNWATGLLYKSVSGNNVRSFGISTFRLNSFASKNGSRLDQRKYGFNAHGSYDIDLYKNFSITPGFLYSNFEFSKLLNVNTNVSYWINKENMSKVYVGLGITDIERTIIYAGATFNGINIGLAYELSKVPTDKTYGIQKGLELCASYTRLAKKH